MTMKCRYVYKCKLYDETAVCCNNDEEATGYCGAWKKFRSAGEIMK